MKNLPVFLLSAITLSISDLALAGSHHSSEPASSQPKKQAGRLQTFVNQFGKKKSIPSYQQDPEDFTFSRVKSEDMERRAQEALERVRQRQIGAAQGLLSHSGSQKSISRSPGSSHSPSPQRHALSRPSSREPPVDSVESYPGPVAKPGSIGKVSEEEVEKRLEEARERVRLEKLQQIRSQYGGQTQPRRP